MHETFKNVSIFLMFLIAVLLWNAARYELMPHFNFDHGRTVLLMVWSSCVVILFHLLYHYFGKSSEKMTYICTILTVATVVGLVHFKIIPISYLS